MQGRFLPWAGCSISDLKLTCSSAQGECPPARAPVKSAGAEPTENLLSASKKKLQNSCYYFLFQVTLLSETETLWIYPYNKIYTRTMWAVLPAVGLQNNPGLELRVPYSWTILQPSASCCNLPIADTSQLKPRSGLNTAGVYFSDELWTDHFSTQHWTELLTCVILLSLTAALCPDYTSITEYNGKLPERQQRKSHSRRSSSSPWGAPVQQMGLLLTACCTLLLQLNL